MNILDIIVLILLIWAIYNGFRDGIVVQLGGLAGLFIGIYLAFRYLDSKIPARPRSSNGGGNRGNGGNHNNRNRGNNNRSNGGS